MAAILKLNAAGLIDLCVVRYSKATMALNSGASLRFYLDLGG